MNKNGPYRVVELLVSFPHLCEPSETLVCQTAEHPVQQEQVAYYIAAIHKFINQVKLILPNCSSSEWFG